MYFIFGFVFLIGPCFKEQVKCSNGRCIQDDLRCSEYNPCGDNSDCPVLEKVEEQTTSFSYYVLCKFENRIVLSA